MWLQQQLIYNSPRMMASSVAVQGSGMLSVGGLLLSAGIRLSGETGLAAVLVMRLPVSQISLNY